MPLSDYYARLRDRIGHDLVLVPAVAAVIHDAAGRLLVIARPDGRLSLPAGAVEPGETPEAALRREVREEAGLIVETARLLGVFGGVDYRARYPNGDQVEFVTSLFAAEVADGRPTSSEEGEPRFVEFDSGLRLETEFPRDLLGPPQT